MDRHTNLATIMSDAVDAANGAHVRMVPGIVLAFHPGKSGVGASVDVQCAVNDVREDLDTGARVSEPWDPIPNVPIAWPKFGGFVLMGPMKAGDKVLLYAFDLDPSAHQVSGGREDPVHVRRNGGNHWVAYPADITDASAPASGAAAANALILGADGGSAQIVINGSTIQLGATGGDFAALASKVDAGFASVVAALNAHVHNSTAPGSPTGPSTPSATAPASVASALVALQ